MWGILMLDQGWVGSSGLRGSHVATILGAFGAPSIRPPMPQRSCPSLSLPVVGIPMSVPPCCSNPPALLQSSSIVSCPCEPCPTSSHGPAIEPDEHCPWPWSLSLMHPSWSLSLVFQNLGLLLSYSGRYCIPRHIRGRSGV